MDAEGLSKIAQGIDLRLLILDDTGCKCGVCVCVCTGTHVSKYMCSPLWKIVLWHLLTPSDGKLSGLGREERTFLLFLQSPCQGSDSHSRAEGGHQKPRKDWIWGPGA